MNPPFNNFDDLTSMEPGKDERRRFALFLSIDYVATWLSARKYNFSVGRDLLEDLTWPFSTTNSKTRSEIP